MNKITVIIPVYNVEKYLNDTMQSVINQTYKNLEIILVDDGSKDLSGKICDEYKKKDKRIKVFHQENKGLSGARNTGLKNATGEYIMFLDSDDKYEENSCEILAKEIEEKNADFITGNYSNMDENGTDWEEPMFSRDKYQECKLSIKNKKASFYLMNSSVTNKIFRKSFLDSLRLQFVEGAIAEDAIFSTRCFIESKNVYYIPDIVYRYRQHKNNSISNSYSVEYFKKISEAYKIIYNNFVERNEMEFYRFFYAKSMNYILCKFIDSKKFTYEDKIDVLSTLKWFFKLNNLLKIPTKLKYIHYIVESINKGEYEQAIKYCEIISQIREMLPKEIKEKMLKPNAETYLITEDND